MLLQKLFKKVKLSLRLDISQFAPLSVLSPETLEIIMKKLHFGLFLTVVFCLLSPAVSAQKSVKPIVSKRSDSRKYIKKTADTSPVTKFRLETVDEKVVRYAAENGIPERLFRSLIFAESANRAQAFSPKGAACYTQLMPATARRFGLQVDSTRRIDERWNVDKCLSAGAKYLNWLLRTFGGDTRLALAGYNAGEGAVMKFGNRVPPYKETVQYVEKILYYYTGQRGHGISAAYNQNLAQSWVNQFYARFDKYNKSAVNTAIQNNTPIQKQVRQSDAAGNYVEADGLAIGQTDEPEKGGSTTRIELQRTPARIRAQTLVFKDNF